MSKAKAKATPNTFTVQIVKEIPEGARTARKSQFDAVIAQVPAKGALELTFTTKEKAAGSRNSLRGYLKRKGLTGDYILAKQNDKVYITKVKS